MISKSLEFDDVEAVAWVVVIQPKVSSRASLEELSGRIVERRHDVQTCSLKVSVTQALSSREILPCHALENCICILAKRTPNNAPETKFGSSQQRQLHTRRT